MLLEVIHKNEVWHSLNQLVTCFTPFEKYACWHRTVFGFFFQLYSQTNTPGNEITSWILEWFNYLNHEWIIPILVDKLSVDDIFWYSMKHQLMMPPCNLKVNYKLISESCYTIHAMIIPFKRNTYAADTHGYWVSMKSICRQSTCIQWYEVL